MGLSMSENPCLSDVTMPLQQGMGWYHIRGVFSLGARRHTPCARIHHIQQAGRVTSQSHSPETSWDKIVTKHIKFES